MRRARGAALSPDFSARDTGNTKARLAKRLRGRQTAFLNAMPPRSSMVALPGLVLWGNTA